MLTLTWVAQKAILDDISRHQLAGPNNGPLDGLVVGLFTGTPAVQPYTLLTDLTEANYNGYGRSAAVAWGPRYLDTTGAYTVKGDAKQFLAADALTANAISGAMLISGNGTGTNEEQDVAITGTPTGGTFTLTKDGQVSAPLPFNATSSQVQTALQAMSTIGAGNVVCNGGPLPGTAVTCVFTGALGTQNVSAMTGQAGGLTGGTTPAVTVTTPVPGVQGPQLFAVDVFDQQQNMNRAGRGFEYVPSLKFPQVAWGAGTVVA